MALDLFSYLLGSTVNGGGGSKEGTPFKSLTLEEDGGYTAIDWEDNEHTIEVEEENGRIVGLTYDGKEIGIEYDDDGNLVKVGNGDIDVSLYPNPEPSGNIGYQVTFKVGGNDYYIASCQQGESITEPPIPTMQGATFGAWQLNGVDITFPYTPSADVELTAHFATVRTEMEIYNAGTVIRTNVTKANDGMAIAGRTSYWGGSLTIYLTLLVSQTQNATTMTGSNIQTGTITYDDETWYYSNAIGDGQNQDFWEATGVNSAATLAKAILDHYFYND